MRDCRRQIHQGPPWDWKSSERTKAHQVPGTPAPRGLHSCSDHLPAADTGGLMHTATLRPFLQSTDDKALVKVKSAGVPVGQEGIPTIDLGLLP